MVILWYIWPTPISSNFLILTAFAECSCNCGGIRPLTPCNPLDRFSLRIGFSLGASHPFHPLTLAHLLRPFALIHLHALPPPQKHLQSSLSPSDPASALLHHHASVILPLPLPHMKLPIVIFSTTTAPHVLLSK